MRNSRNKASKFPKVRTLWVAWSWSRFFGSWYCRKGKHHPRTINGSRSFIPDDNRSVILSFQSKPIIKQDQHHSPPIHVKWDVSVVTLILHPMLHQAFSSLLSILFSLDKLLPSFIQVPWYLSNATLLTIAEHLAIRIKGKSPFLLYH